MIASTTAEIASLKKGLEELDKSVAEATELRKEEHAEYTSTAAANQAAVELIGMAKNRLNKFYAPDQYKAPETTTESSSPYGFAQVAMKSRRADPGPAPEMPSGEYKKNEQSGGVIAMMDQMIRDVEMDMQEAKMDEAEAQKDYEETMQDGATKREEDSKLIVEKEAGKSDQQQALIEARETRATKSDQHGIATTKLNDLHGDCDFLLESYDKKKQERLTEMDGLNEGKATLAGAR